MEASVIKKNREKIEIQMKYTNDLMKSFRKEFIGNAWRHPEQHDLKITDKGDLMARWSNLGKVLE